jgi:hypothetical protein
MIVFYPQLNPFQTIPVSGGTSIDVVTTTNPFIEFKENNKTFEIPTTYLVDFDTEQEFEDAITPK